MENIWCKSVNKPLSAHTWEHVEGTHCDSFPSVTIPFLPKKSVAQNSAGLNLCSMLQRQINDPSSQCHTVCTALANCPCYKIEITSLHTVPATSIRQNTPRGLSPQHVPCTLYHQLLFIFFRSESGLERAQCAGSDGNRLFFLRLFPSLHVCSTCSKSLLL